MRLKIAGLCVGVKLARPVTSAGDHGVAQSANKAGLITFKEQSFPRNAN
jgi:hypothetical protein